MPDAPPVAVTVQDSQLHAKWQAYLERYERDAIEEAAWSYPDQKSLVVAFRDLERGDPELTDYLLDKPAHCLRMGTAALAAMEMPVDPKPRLNLRVHGLPEDMILLPRDLRSDHLGRLVPVEGIIQAKSEARNLPAEAAWECKSCGNVAHVLQEEEVLAEPPMCDACEKSGHIWRLREDLTTWVDSQILIIQERPDQLRGGAHPECRYLLCRDDLVHGVEAGDHVVANCIPITRTRRIQGGAKATEFDTALQAISLERPGDEYADSEITDEQRRRYEELAKRGDALGTLMASYAPFVQGLDSLKRALIYALVGAPDRSSDGSMAVRGNIHVLLVGDPGVAKSQLILDMEKCAPRCTIATGTTTSGAGLGAAVTHDKGMGKWILEAGAAVLADGGVCAVDELGHMHPDDQQHLHTIMQEGVVRVNKAVKAILRANTTIVAAMNPPVGERFDEYAPLLDQIGIKSALLSRFDLVYCVQDRVDEDRDAEVARSVLGRRNGMAASLQERALDPDDFRRYLTLARQVNPHLQSDAVQYITEYYQKLRKATRDRPGITPRSVDGLGRLAVANARIRLSDEATLEDAEAAVEVLEDSLRSRGAIDEHGSLDSDALVTGAPASQNDRMRLMLQMVKDFQRGHALGYNRGWASEEDIIERAGEHGISEDQARKALETLTRNNTIYARGGAGTYAVLAS